MPVREANIYGTTQNVELKANTLQQLIELGKQFKFNDNGRCKCTVFGTNDFVINRTSNFEATCAQAFLTIGEGDQFGPGYTSYLFSDTLKPFNMVKGFTHSHPTAFFKVIDFETYERAKHFFEFSKIDEGYMLTIPNMKGLSYAFGFYHDIDSQFATLRSLPYNVSSDIEVMSNLRKYRSVLNALQLRIPTKQGQNFHLQQFSQENIAVFYKDAGQIKNFNINKAQYIRNFTDGDCDYTQEAIDSLNSNFDHIKKHFMRPYMVCTIQENTKLDAYYADVDFIFEQQGNKVTVVIPQVFSDCRSNQWQKVQNLCQPFQRQITYSPVSQQCQYQCSVTQRSTFIKFPHRYDLCDCTDVTLNEKVDYSIDIKTQVYREFQNLDSGSVMGIILFFISLIVLFTLNMYGPPVIAMAFFAYGIMQSFRLDAFDFCSCYSLATTLVTTVSDFKDSEGQDFQVYMAIFSIGTYSQMVFDMRTPNLYGTSHFAGSVVQTMAATLIMTKMPADDRYAGQIYRLSKIPVIVYYALKYFILPYSEGYDDNILTSIMSQLPAPQFMAYSYLEQFRTTVYKLNFDNYFRLNSLVFFLSEDICFLAVYFTLFLLYYAILQRLMRSFDQRVDYSTVTPLMIRYIFENIYGLFDNFNLKSENLKAKRITYFQHLRALIIFKSLIHTLDYFGIGIVTSFLFTMLSSSRIKLQFSHKIFEYTDPDEIHHVDGDLDDHRFDSFQNYFTAKHRDIIRQRSVTIHTLNQRGQGCHIRDSVHTVAHVLNNGDDKAGTHFFDNKGVKHPVNAISVNQIAKDFRDTNQDKAVSFNVSLSDKTDIPIAQLDDSMPLLMYSTNNGQQVYHIVNNTAWFTSEEDKRLLCYYMQTNPGDSGCGIYSLKNDQLVLVGCHAHAQYMDGELYYTAARTFADIESNRAKPQAILNANFTKQN